MVKDPAHVTLSGDISGAYVVCDQRPNGGLVIAPETEWQAMLARTGAREATPDELAAFDAEHGPLLPADGER